MAWIANGSVRGSGTVDRMQARLGIDATSKLTTLLPLAGVAVAGALSVARCDPPDPVQPPSMAWNGRSYLAAWSVTDRRGVAVYVHRFGDARSYDVNRKDPPIVRSTEIRTRPQLLPGRDGFLLVYNQGDAPGEPDWHPRRTLVATPLDLDGVVRGPSQATPAGLSPDSLCQSPVWNGVVHVLGYVEHGRHHRHPHDTLGLIFLDARATYLGRRVLDTGFIGRCVLALRGEVLAIATMRHAALTGPWGRIDFVSADTGRELAKGLVLHMAEGWPDLGLQPYGDGWAVLYQDDQRVVRVVRFDPQVILEDLALPDDIDPRSMDLGVNERGLFVTWLADGKTHLRGVTTGSREHTAPTGGTSGGTRAIGHDDECAVAWSNHDGTRLRLLTAKACPRVPPGAAGGAGRP
jgi:hypothetical protein